MTEVPEELTYEQKLEQVSIIAKPMASKKLAKKCYKLIKKGKACFVYHNNKQRVHKFMYLLYLTFIYNSIFHWQLKTTKCM